MQRIGSRAQVMHGKAKQTGGGLKKKDLKYNKQGKIVSKKKSQLAKKENRLQKAGYITKKGQFGAIRSMIGGGLLYINVYNDDNLTEPNYFLNFLLENLGKESKVFTESLRDRDRIKSLVEKIPVIKFNKLSVNEGKDRRIKELQAHLKEVNIEVNKEVNKLVGNELVDYNNSISPRNLGEELFNTNTLQSYNPTNPPHSKDPKEYSIFRTFEVEYDKKDVDNNNQKLYIHISKYRLKSPYGWWHRMVNYTVQITEAPGKFDKFDKDCMDKLKEHIVTTKWGKWGQYGQAVWLDIVPLPRERRDDLGSENIDIIKYQIGYYLKICGIIVTRFSYIEPTPFSTSRESKLKYITNPLKVIQFNIQIKDNPEEKGLMLYAIDPFDFIVDNHLVDRQEKSKWQLDLFDLI